jgi:hypothetical protein
MGCIPDFLDSCSQVRLSLICLFSQIAKINSVYFRQILSDIFNGSLSAPKLLKPGSELSPSSARQCIRDKKKRNTSTPILALGSCAGQANVEVTL